MIIEKHTHTKTIEITHNGQSKVVLIVWAFGSFDVPVVKAVLDGRENIYNDLDYIARGAVGMTVDREALQTPFEIQVANVVEMLTQQRAEVA
ncbi:MAG: hypothetical protein LAT56_14670 [Wenzhouxiangella sp.]|nr:hypothetical protein [Wenzhouxiangella sp.]